MNNLATLVPLGCPSLNTVMLISNSMSCGPSSVCIKLNRASLWNFSMLKMSVLIHYLFFTWKNYDVYSLEIVVVGASHVGRCLCVWNRHIEVDVLIPTGPLQCEQGTSLRRQRQVRDQRDEVECIRHGSSVAFCVALFARQRNPLASAAIENGQFGKFDSRKSRCGRISLFVVGIIDVVGRAILLGALVTSFDIRADLIVSVAYTCWALINVLARSVVAGQTVSSRTGALIRAVCILAHAHAQIGRFMHFAFVDVFARAIVHTQMVASLACATIRAPIINATLRTQARCFGAFVDVDAGFFIVSMPLEAVFTFASIRSDRIQALRISWAYLKMERVSFQCAVGAVARRRSPVRDRIRIRWYLRIVSGHSMCGRRGTSKYIHPAYCGKFHPVHSWPCVFRTHRHLFAPSQCQLFRNVRFNSIKILTDALCSLVVRRESPRAREQTDTLIRAVCVLAALITSTRIAHVAFIDVNARTLTAAMEAKRTWAVSRVPVALSAWMGRCGHRRRCVPAQRCGVDVSSRRCRVEVRVLVWSGCGGRSDRGGAGGWCWRGRRVSRTIASETALGVSAYVWRHAVVSIENAFVVVWIGENKVQIWLNGDPLSPLEIGNGVHEPSQCPVSAFKVYPVPQLWSLMHVYDPMVLSQRWVSVQSWLFIWHSLMSTRKHGDVTQKKKNL